MQEAFELAFPILRALLYLVLAVLVFFVYEGFREAKQYGPIQGKFNIRELKWENENISVGKSLILSSMFIVGLVGVWGLTLWGRYLSIYGTFSAPLIGLWFFSVVFCVALILVAYNRWLMFGAIVGYWLAWKFGQVKAARDSSSQQQTFRK